MRKTEYVSKGRHISKIEDTSETGYVQKAQGMHGRIVEICCGGFADALTAEKGGARRVELNSALPLGGLTPSAASLRLVKAHTSLETICMVRPRAAGFAYSDAEFEQMKAETKALLAAGADGIAFGILTPVSTVDLARSRVLADIVHEAGAVAVFHRAFDMTPQPFDAIEALIELVHADRVLTSGQRPTALASVSLIARLQREYGAEIEILPGSGITPDNVSRFIRETNVGQVHASCKSKVEDPTTQSPFVSFAYLDGADTVGYEKVTFERVCQLVKNVSELPA